MRGRAQRISRAAGIVSSLIGSPMAHGGFEDRSLSVADWRDLPDERRLAAARADHGSDLRMTKDAASWSTCSVTRAVRVTQRSKTFCPRIRPGVTEREVARWIDDGLRDRSEGPGFDTIVAAGANGAIPHHQPTDRPIVGR